MAKTGILVHVYHLSSDGWEEFVWGDPHEDKLGTLTKFAECILNIPFDESVDSIVYSGPSQKDGMTEGGYTRQYLIDRIDKLAEFPRLKRKIELLTQDEYDQFVRRLHNLVEGKLLKNTMDEVVSAAEFFTEKKVDTVWQIAAATHAPRCMKTQGVANHHGLLSKDQLWSVIASDTCHTGKSPEDIAIFEPPSRGDDPMKGFRPTLPEALGPYLGLSPDKKKVFIQKANALLSDLRRR